MPNTTTFADGREAAGMAPACISAINGKLRIPNGLRPGFLGEDIFIHPNYVQFRPCQPAMNKSKNQRKHFKPDPLFDSRRFTKLGKPCQ